MGLFTTPSFLDGAIKLLHCIFGVFEISMGALIKFYNRL